MLEALMTDTMGQARELYTLDALQVTCGTIGMPTASVRPPCRRQRFIASAA